MSAELEQDGGEYVMSIGFEEGNVISISGDREDFLRLCNAIKDDEEAEMITSSIESFVSLIDKEGETVQ